MKKMIFSVLMLATLLGSCSKDANNPNPLVILHFDGPNQTAPVLPEGEYEAAARFTSAETANYAGKNLTGVSFYLTQLPLRVEMKIYGEGTANSPGDLLYSASVSTQVQANKWNDYSLTNPVAITGGDLWISISLSHSKTQPSIGCDPGPAIPNGDWLFDSADNQWIPFKQRSGASINWNIRGTVSD